MSYAYRYRPWIAGIRGVYGLELVRMYVAHRAWDLKGLQALGQGCRFLRDLVPRVTDSGFIQTEAYIITSTIL